MTRPRILDILDKGKAAIAIVGGTSVDAATGCAVARTEFTSYIRGAGGFGRARAAAERPAAAVAANLPPARAPDRCVRERTTEAQAALYRLNGDYNPLHIDPSAAAQAGFDRPILHGLCTFGIAGKHVLMEFGGGLAASMKSIKVLHKIGRRP